MKLLKDHKKTQPPVEIFYLNDIIKNPVYDSQGEDFGRLYDLISVRGLHYPVIKALLVKSHAGNIYRIEWDQIKEFSKDKISINLPHEELTPYEIRDEDILVLRDIVNHHFVDALTAKVLKIYDVLFEFKNGRLFLVAVETGKKAITRKLGFEKQFESLARLLKIKLPKRLIRWNRVQPTDEKLKKVTLSVSSRKLSELHPADIAEAINTLPKDKGAQVFGDLDIETAASTLHELNDDIKHAIISEMNPLKAAAIIKMMPPDEAADILNELDPDKAQTILNLIEKEEAEDIQELLVYEEGTAGALMTNEFLAYPPDLTIAETIKRFKEDARDIETVYYIYVVNEYGKLLGVTSLREVLLAEPDTRLSDIMVTKVIKVTPDEPVEKVTDLMSKYNLVAVPVVCPDGVLEGIITVDDIMDAMEEEATEDIFMIAGTSEVRFGKIEDASPVEIVRTRLPWLLLCLLGGLISSAVISKYGSRIAAFVALAPFIPVIMGMAGNTGLQVSTTLVRSLALNTVTNIWRYALKEILSSLFIAAITGSLIAVAAVLINKSPWVGMVVGVAMFLSISTSTILAIITPAIANKLGIDPAVTSGPFVTVFNDILGLTIYFTVASVSLGFIQ